MIKREIHYSSSDDETPNSDIVYYYNDDGSIKEKIYNDFLNGRTSFILQKDTFYYTGSRLVKKIHFFREGLTTSPLSIAEITYYSYPDDQTRIEVTWEETGELEDSIIYYYSDNKIINEKHYKKDRQWEKFCEYNSNGKLLMSTELPGQHKHKNLYDNNGLLYKSQSWLEDELLMEYIYERLEKGNELIIQTYCQSPGNDNKTISSQVKYMDGFLTEYIRFHPTFPGSQWWCHKYEYYDEGEL